jgi:hypothetical protein
LLTTVSEWLTVAARLDPLSQSRHARRYGSEKLIYETAIVLIDRHGAKAMKVANRLLVHALDRAEKDRALIMLRVQLAVTVLQARRVPPCTDGRVAGTSAHHRNQLGLDVPVRCYRRQQPIRA